MYSLTLKFYANEALVFSSGNFEDSKNASRVIRVFTLMYTGSTKSKGKERLWKEFETTFKISYKVYHQYTYFSNLNIVLSTLHRVSGRVDLSRYLEFLACQNYWHFSFETFEFNDIYTVLTNITCAKILYFYFLTFPPAVVTFISDSMSLKRFKKFNKINMKVSSWGHRQTLYCLFKNIQKSAQ